MAKTRITIVADIRPAAKVTLVAHAALQKMKKKGTRGVLFGKHVPDWKLVTASIEWDMDKKTKAPKAVSEVSLSFRFTGQICISKAIDKSSTCFALVKAHEQEHHKICAAGTNAAVSACQAILKKHVQAVTKGYKDIAAMEKDEATAVRKIVVGAFKEMDDGPFYKVAVKSLAIDTAAHYNRISPHCAAYG